jgi:hypothetical protein
MNAIKKGIAVFCAVFIFSVSAAQTLIIPVGHSHNDYTRKRPLHDALDNGFFSVEVDIFYRNGNFLVAHTVLGIKKKKTIEKLYLEPLKLIVEKNKGKVYPDGPLEFEMMIDFKGQWTIESMRELENKLLEFTSLLTRYENGIHRPNAVKVLLSGGGYLNWVRNDNPRLFSVDAGLGDITSEHDAYLICRNSGLYGSNFKWRGKGEMPVEEKEKLFQLCNEAKQHGRKIRFWSCPHNENVWRELLDAGVGWVNVDRLKKFRMFYFENYLPSKK